MSMRALAVGVAALVWAVPAVAQQRGTMEFGAFASAAKFDNNLSLTTGYGGGGRIAMYLDPRVSIEFEKAEMRAKRPNGLRDVNVGIVGGRLVVVPATAGRLSFVLGAGAGISTETNFLHTYGVQGLAGLKLAVGNSAALRLDGLMDFLANEDWKRYQTVRLGLTVFRHPARMTRTVMRDAPAMTMVHEDSVSASETRRLRDRDMALRALRDSLNNAPATCSVTLEATIAFAMDGSELTSAAKSLIDEKMSGFCANPATSTTIFLIGYRDIIGKDSRNIELGARRAQAAKDYLVARGVAPERISIASRAEPSQARNPGGFSLLISPDFKK